VGEVVLVAEDLWKGFGGRVVLRGVSLMVRAGEAVAVLGPNGSGKTTLLRVLATLLLPDAGRLRLFGQDPSSFGASLRARIGFTTHEALLYGGLTVEENLRLFASLYGVKTPRVEAWMRKSGLWPRRGEVVRTLSRGWLQRATLVRALLPAPPLLLLDEPFTGLDAEGVGWLRGVLLDHLRAGGALVLTTNRPEEVEGIARSVLLLESGRLVPHPKPDASNQDGRTLQEIPTPDVRPPGFGAALWALLQKELRIELRTREILPAMGLMALVAIVLFSVTVGLDPALVRSAAPGLLWTTFTFAAMLGLSRAQAVERERAAALAVLAAPVDRGAILAAKAISQFLWILATELLSLVAFGVLLNIDLWPRLGTLLPVLLLGSAGLSLVGTLLSAVAAGTRLREVLLPLLLVPMALPLLIGAARATAKVLEGLPLWAAWPELRVVGAFGIILGAASLVLFERVAEEGV
jgi:heme ABC exporter ATP-binding subunit CcmA/heme exporter protein CcmB